MLQLEVEKFVTARLRIFRSEPGPLILFLTFLGGGSPNKNSNSNFELI